MQVVDMASLLRFLLPLVAAWHAAPASHAGEDPESRSFDVLPPGSQDVALHGAIELQDWQGALPADGERAPFTLTVSITDAAPTAGYGGTAARAGGGAATVAVSTDHGASAGNGGLRATREADLNLIETGEERYEVPDAVVSGG